MGTYHGILRSRDTLKTLELTGASVRNVFDVKVLGNDLLAATDSGVHISYDDGLIWKRISAKASVNAIGCIADTLYAGTNSGLFYSSDTGKVWTKVAFFGNQTIKRLTQNAEELYIYTQNQLFRKTLKSGIVEVHLGGLAGEYLDVLNLGRTQLVSSYWGMVFSEDGVNWTPITSPLKSNQLRSFTSLATDGATIFAASEGTGGYISYDEGMTWLMRSPPFHYEAVWGIGGAYYADGFWFCRAGKGPFRSSDDGRSWKMINENLDEFTSVNCFFKVKDMLWLGTSKGLFYSLNNGDQWLEPEGKIYTEIRSFVISRNGKLFAFGGNNHYESEPPYSSWKAGSLTFKQEFSCAAQNGDTIYAASFSDDIYRSFDGGDKWTLIKKGIAQGTISHLTVTPEYVLTIDGMGDLFIRMHSDTAWAPFNGNLPFKVKDLLVIGDTVYGAIQFERLYRRNLRDYESPLGLGNSFHFRDMLSFFPNPARDVITFANPALLMSIEVLDLTGNKVLQSQATAQLSVSDLPLGVYVVRTTLKDGSILTGKVIRQ
ncbi:T9SS type A sorting domain-containing protein [Sporocytophaga myxococcoides]|uniref:T9SS type A sorting domain-containing protein n=1 Tax=Sporocytophaga myxococcoides TaxID=153721 RepID=UPI0005EF1FA5|nr:T9SS type A sorting domain-containing protein [Sporocytophaga myxococcoides]